MKIYFLTKGKKETSQIYIRLRDNESKIDATSKTGIFVFSSNFKKGEIIHTKNPKNADANLKSKIAKENEGLNLLDEKLTEIKKSMVTAFNNRQDYEIINSKWLYNIIKPKNEKTKVPNELALYFKYYRSLKIGDLEPSTLKKLQSIENRLIAFENDTNTVIYLQEVNKAFRQDFKLWCNEKKYHRNTYIKSIKVFTTVCKHAKSEYDIELHPHTLELSKGNEMKYSKSKNIWLTFDELKQIENADLKISELDVARDWLLISCYTAQRISDFMTFSINDIVSIDGNKFLDINQNKTSEPVLVYLNDVVLNIIKKYDGEFPPLFSDVSKASNELNYNRLIKKVCFKSGITDLVTAQIKNPKTNRTEIKTLEKYKFVSSHIGRRSYASNYYGEIPTALLLSATGHKSEVQFLRYVQKAPKQNAKSLAEAMQNLSQKKSAPMKVIKNVVNQ